MATICVPPHARHLRTYAELRSYLADFVRGIYPFLWVVGQPGTGKTESLRAALGGRDHYYQKGGQLTPLQFYLDCHEHLGQPIILDDAEHLLDHKVGARLVSSLGDTTQAKLLCYSAAARAALGGVPPRYYTTSPLCVLANRTTTHLDIQSRAVILHFDPTPLEVHLEVGRWFWDQEVHDWFGRHLPNLRVPDVRWYITADCDKRAGRDWQQIALRGYAHDPAACVVRELEGDPAYPTREDKARRFEELMAGERGASRASYFRLRRRLEGRGQLSMDPAPRVTLRRTRRPGTPSPLELDSMAAPAPAAEEVTGPADLPARDAFARPIQGRGGAQARPTRPLLDDNLPWEARQAQDDEEGDEG